MRQKSRLKKKPPGWISPSVLAKSKSLSSPVVSGEKRPSSPLTEEPSSPVQLASAEISSLCVATVETLDKSDLLKSSDLLAHDAEPMSISDITNPSVKESVAGKLAMAVASSNLTAKAVNTVDPATETKSDWLHLFKGPSKSLSKKGKAFILPSGEACVKIPNSVIEKHQKSWESFIIGQFYSEPPSQGIIHTIVNGIWSRQFCDISVSKLEGNAFLFRIPNFQTRNRVVNQRLWNIEGQTMFVAKWVPGVIPAKPELSSAPIWLELRAVPFQFFNEDGLEYIAGLVGEPKFLHPATANKTNLEVAKVFTLIDPRKPLPEAVNAQFQTGEVRRIRVSSPWMPQICSHCKEIGHSIKRCSSAPISCSGCNSSKHTLALCPRLGKKKRKQWVSIEKQSVMQGSEQVSAQSDGVSSLLCEDARSLSAEDSGKLSAVVSGKLFGWGLWEAAGNFA